MQDFRTSASAYAVAVGSVVLGIAVRLLLAPLLGDAFPFATVFLAVMVTAWFGGFRPALLAVALGGIGSAFFLLPTRSPWTVLPGDQIGLVLYVAVALGLAWLGGAMHSARATAHEQMEHALEPGQA
jgi:K+-sensing histidine kinase KdpD